MCLVAIAYKKWPGFPIMILANRDEFFDRPASAADFWNENASILGGRDLLSLGTWFGVTKSGRISFITNRRDFREAKLSSPISRGKLVENFLKTDMSPSKYERSLQPDLLRYEGFNLFVMDPNEALCISNRGQATVSVETGFHALSNAYWNTPWPKTERILSKFQSLSEEMSTQVSLDEFVSKSFGILNDQTFADESNLPDTGIGMEKEKMLSSIRIKLPNYGTRVSTILTVSDQGVCNFWERTFQDPFSESGETRHFSFQIIQ